MEDSVKDLDGDINPSNPEPRFSIGAEWKKSFKSMNDEGEYQRVQVIHSNYS